MNSRPSRATLLHWARTLHDGALCAAMTLALLLLACLPVMRFGAAPAEALAGLVTWCACGGAAVYIVHGGIPVKLPGHPVSFAIRGFGLLLLWPVFLRRRAPAT